MGLFDKFKKQKQNEVNETPVVKVTSYSTNDVGELSFSIAGTKFRTQGV